MGAAAEGALGLIRPRQERRCGTGRSVGMWPTAAVAPGYDWRHLRDGKQDIWKEGSRCAAASRYPLGRARV